MNWGKKVTKVAFIYMVAVQSLYMLNYKHSEIHKHISRVGKV